MKKKKKILFVHIPQKRQGISFVNFAPVGTFALADLVSREGFQTLIVDTLVEQIVDSSFSLLSFISKGQYNIICIPLHWHYQANDVIRTIAEIKSECPKAIIILGGYTASLFATEIMHNYSVVDFVIRGEAELPLIELLNRIEDSSTYLDLVPNLVWRNSLGKIIVNKLGWLADSEFINKLNYANLSLLRNSQVYTRLPETGINLTDRYLLRDRPRFVLNTGRGCPVQCFYCGGGVQAQRLITRREKFVFRSSERVLEEIRSLASFGVQEIMFDYDPDPKGNYYTNLFSQIASSGLTFSCIFASWGLPSTRLIDSFYRSGIKKFELILSPDFGNEKIRGCNKGFYFSNIECTDLLTYIDKQNECMDLKIKVTVYFFVGAPNETESTLFDTKNFAEKLNRFKCVKQIIAQAPQVEPGSPISNCKKLNSTRKLFADFIKFSQQTGQEGSNVDYKTLMGFTPIDLSVDKLPEWVKQINSFSKSTTFIAEGPIHLESLNVRLYRSSRFQLRTWFQYSDQSFSAEHYTLEDQNNSREFVISNFDALVYRYADGQRTILDVLQEIQELLTPISPDNVMKAFFETVKTFVSKGILGTMETLQ